MLRSCVLLLEQAGLLAFWAFLVSAAVAGLVALISPRTFVRLSAQSSRWLDASKVLRWLDQTRFNVDPLVLPFSRLLGGITLASVALLAYLFTG